MQHKASGRARNWLLLLVVVALNVIIWRADRGDWEAARINQQISVDLPVGSFIEDVKKWLANRGIEAQARTNNEGGILHIWATLYREYLMDWNGYLEFEFTFDEQGLLQDRRVQWASLAP